MRNYPVQPAYPYCIYKDDDKISAMFQGFNGYVQDYIDSFINLNLPIYTSKQNAFLDWVGENIYGITRPYFPIGIDFVRGELNNVLLNEQELNSLRHFYPQSFIAADDDVYRRVITWHHYKGDGDFFDIRWLKRRVMRFLTNAYIDQTYQISVGFGGNAECYINIMQTGINFNHPSAMVNDGAFNEVPLNELTATRTTLPQMPLAETFRLAVLTGALELPFQYKFFVNII